MVVTAVPTEAAQFISELKVSLALPLIKLALHAWELFLSTLKWYHFLVTNYLGVF